MDRQTKREILLLAFGTILAEAPLLAIAAVKRNRKGPICFSPYLYRARRMPSPRSRARASGLCAPRRRSRSPASHRSEVLEAAEKRVDGDKG
jgi:hypothetical protein